MADPLSPSDKPVTRRCLVVVVLLAVWLAAMAVVVKTSLDRLVVPPWGNPVGEGLSAEVAGDTQVGQRFTAPLPGLYRIEVTLDRATARSPHPITFHLKTDPAAADDLWTAQLSTEEVQTGVPYRFEFPPLRNSKGQTFYFYLESADSVPGDAIAVRYSPGATLDGASACLNGEAVAGDLQFHSFYTLRTRDKADLLLTRLAEGRPYLLGVKGFYVGLALIYALVLTLFLLQTARAIR